MLETIRKGGSWRTALCFPCKKLRYLRNIYRFQACGKIDRFIGTNGQFEEPRRIKIFNRFISPDLFLGVLETFVPTTLIAKGSFAAALHIEMRVFGIHLHRNAVGYALKLRIGVAVLVGQQSYVAKRHQRAQLKFRVAVCLQ